MGDFTKDALPKNFDVVFSRDALQHLSPMQIISALRTFKNSSPRFLLVGSYPQGVNVAIDTGAYFPINLMREPYSLWPSEIYSESFGGIGEVKHVLVYTRSDMERWDLDAIARHLQYAI